jgi:hypothetical protein
MSGNNAEWIKRRKELLSNIKKFKSEGDRLSKTTQINYMHNAMHESVVGFSGWLNGWISTELTKKIKVDEQSIPILTDKELDDFFMRYQDIATKFIELDIEITDSITKKAKKKTIFNKFEIKDTSSRMVV